MFGRSSKTKSLVFGSLFAFLLLMTTVIAIDAGTTRFNDVRIDYRDSGSDVKRLEVKYDETGQNYKLPIGVDSYKVDEVNAWVNESYFDNCSDAKANTRLDVAIQQYDHSEDQTYTTNLIMSEDENTPNGIICSDVSGDPFLLSFQGTNFPLVEPLETDDYIYHEFTLQTYR